MARSPERGRTRLEPGGDALESATIAGREIRDDATYSLATTEYLLHSDREFPALDIDPTSKPETYSTRCWPTTPVGSASTPR
nr:hypothetical protein [Haladaptatus sp. W1]